MIWRPRDGLARRGHGQAAAWLIAGLLACATLTGPLAAQQAPPTDAAPAADTAAQAAGDRTLADLRGDLRALSAELQALRAELAASGQAGFQAAGGDAAIDRMNAIESQLAQLTGQAEQLAHRINRLVSDGTRRIEDIEFRLCQMDETCDLGALLTPSDLGSQTGGGGVARPGQGIGTAPAQPTEPDNGMGAARAELDRARTALDQGDNAGAAATLAGIATSYTDPAITAEALFLRGIALDRGGAPDDAALSWIEAFAADPGGPRAADSLLGMARHARDSDAMDDSCLYQAEITLRFPGSDKAATAAAAMAEQGCEPPAASPDGGDETDLDIIDPAVDPEAAADAAEHG